MIESKIEFTEILTDRLRLRALQPKDAHEMQAYRALPEVFQYQGCGAKSLNEVQAFIAGMANVDLSKPGWNQVGIELVNDGSLIGDCGIHILDDTRIAEFGITLDPKHHSKGYATEAVKAVIELLFSKYEKHRVFASVDPRNAPSLALMERLGMRKEGHFIESLWLNDTWVDDVIFAVLENEWKVPF
ncbi:MAG: GNAT family N-acetyltransferase [Cyanobacteria bacterium SZAS-4]|nr:GNAT family N-acetyltransferase [Cyanobacteria bacterium SZAS-4]